MTVLGPSSDMEKFLRGLDEKKLVDLCADLLHIRGHSGLRITDGPGDGGRDIHSLDEHGAGYLTQSKYHTDPSRAVSSSELSDVVRGMLTFGYTKGCFITNARISPQAKRECLNDYPGYSVDFLDGATLVREILGNVVLRALWYDGESIDRVSYVLVIPAVARDLVKDKPLPLLRDRREIYEGDVIIAERSEVQWSLHGSSLHSHALEPYRPPRIKTVSEMNLASIGGVEVVLSGGVSLDDVTALQRRTATELIDGLRSLYGEGREHVAVRLGRPYVSPLGGESAGARIELEGLEPVTFVRHGSEIDYELEWLRPSRAAGWYAPERFSTSASEWVRWYSPRIDACFELTLSSPPSAVSMGMIELQREHYLKWWNESLFVLLPRTAQREWGERNLPEPDVASYWGEEDLLCAWLHPLLLPGIHPMSIQPDEEPGHGAPDEVDPLLSQEKDARQHLEDLQEQLTDFGARAIEPGKARHMIAVVHQDPFPNTKFIEYRPVDMLRDPEIIPSPVDPTARRVRVTVCWLMQAVSADDIDRAILADAITEMVERRSVPFAARIELDFNTQGGLPYLLVHMQYQRPVDFENSSELLSRIEAAAAPVLTDIEKQTTAAYGSVRRATRKYWDDELFIILPDSAPH